ncbi:MAG TPA: hypothetical protein VK755_10620 [Candidatus Acidoferrales bacterium]|nr:hypothetical protein [Candidatus Acidoferrales bacterium]
MRFLTLCASTAIAASLMLSACSNSSGGSQALPSNSQAVAPMGHSAHPHLVVIGAQKFTASCDTSVYLTCVTVSKKSPATLEICYNESGSGCSSGYFPPLTWYEAVYSVKANKIYKKIVGSFYPNPGNPSVDTITALKKVKNSHGVVKYYQYIEGCLYTSDCLTGEIGIATQ